MRLEVNLWKNFIQVTYELRNRWKVKAENKIAYKGKTVVSFCT
jgi:hypothetical protein